jgi:C4-dicarboxylate transporter DctQ subunit
VAATVEMGSAGREGASVAARVLGITAFLDRLLSRAEVLFVGSAMAFTSLLLFVNVVMRYFLLRPIFWAEELTLYLMVWIVFVGGSIVARTRGHIAVDVLPLFLSRRDKRRLRIVATGGSILFCLALFYFSGQHVLRVQSSGQVMPAMQAPMWLAYLAIPVGSLLMAIRMSQGLILILRGPEEEKLRLDVRD